MAITSIMLKKLEVREKRYVIKDDKGLYLEVMPTGNSFWRLRYWINKKEFKLTLAGYCSTNKTLDRLCSIRSELSVEKRRNFLFIKL